MDYEDKKGHATSAKFFLERTPVDEKASPLDKALRQYDAEKKASFDAIAAVPKRNIFVPLFRKNAELMRGWLINWVYFIEKAALTQRTTLLKLNKYINAIEQKSPDRNALAQQFFEELKDLHAFVCATENLNEAVFKSSQALMLPSRCELPQSFTDCHAALSHFEIQAGTRQTVVSRELVLLYTRILYLEVLLRKGQSSPGPMLARQFRSPASKPLMVAREQLKQYEKQAEIAQARAKKSPPGYNSFGIFRRRKARAVTDDSPAPRRSGWCCTIL